jgi:hypothetical protein
MPSPAATELPVFIDVAPDGLSVRLTLRSDRCAKALDAPVIVAHLTQMGIVLTPRGDAEIQELCRPRKPGRTAPPVIVASGTPCVDDRAPALELAAPIAQLPVQKRYVKAGDPVATLVPARSGSDGIDVFGKPMARKKASEIPSIDASLSPSADSRIYHAAIDGVVRVRRDGPAETIAVLPCLQHPGDISGTSTKPFILQSPGEITIDGGVSAANIEAGGAIHIVGDMENSTAACDGDLTASALRAVTLDVAGDCIATSVSQSRIVCGGELIVEEGNVAGGQVIAVRGLRCKSLGSPASSGTASKTIIEIGIDERIRRRFAGTLPEIDAQIAKANNIRTMVEPLQHSLQPLTPRQQARLAELLAEADVLEQNAQRERSELRQQCEAAIARCRYEISVTQIVHVGVTIRFPGAQTTVRIALKGPCRISLEAVNNEPARIMFSQGSAPAFPLELRRLDDDWRAAIKQLAA